MQTQTPSRGQAWCDRNDVDETLYGACAYFLWDGKSAWRSILTKIH